MVSIERTDKPCTGGPESERSYRWPPRLGIRKALFSGKLYRRRVATSGRGNAKGALELRPCGRSLTGPRGNATGNVQTRGGESLPYGRQPTILRQLPRCCRQPPEGL